MNKNFKKTAMRWLGALILLASIVPPAAIAQDGGEEATLLPAAAFFRSATLHEAVLSPSGTRLAITSGANGGRIGLFVVDLVGSDKPVRVAQFGNVDISSIHWVSENRLVFSVSDFSAGSGRGDGGPGLYSVDSQGGPPRELIKRYYSHGYGATALSANHQLLAVPLPVAGKPNEEVLIGQLWGGSSSETPRMRSLWLNVYTGEVRSTDFGEPRGSTNLMADNQGNVRLAMVSKGTDVTLYWRGPGDMGWQVIFEGDVRSMPFKVESIDAAGNLYVSWNEGAAGHLVLGTFDFVRKRPNPEPLVRVRGFDFNGSLLTNRNGHSMGVRLNSDAETTIWFDPQLKAIQAEVDKQLPNRINRLSCRQCESSYPTVLVHSYSDRDPGQIWVYRAQPPEGQLSWKPVGAIHEGLDPARMAGMDFQRIKARDGRDLPVWLTLPRGVKPGQPAPAVVLVHGGPWLRGGNWGWNPMGQFLASRGYLVIEPEFRGSTGYGNAHFRAGWKQWGQAMQDDVADALLWAREQKLADGRACIAGASYGGYSTLMGLVRHPELYRCGISWLAVTDLDLLLKGSWFVRDDTSDLSRKHSLPEMIGDLENDAAMLAANSPVLQAHKIKAPLLLAFGEADMRVPLAHGERMRRALIKSGNEPQWVVYPGEGHGWALLKNKVDFAQRVETFLATHLKAAAP